MSTSKRKQWCIAVCMTWLAGSAGATDGYFSHGYGMRAIGMGGVAVAVTGDAFGGANNPATLVYAGDRLELGVNWFRPGRSAERSGAVLAPLNGQVSSDSLNFLIPEVAYSRRVRSNLSLGVNVYGNGGMNTDYPQGPFQCPNATFQFGPSNMLCGSGRLGVDLTQLIVAPTVSWAFAPGNSVGLSALLAVQRFRLEGAQLFGSNSVDPPHVSNTGYETSSGAGFRIGYLGDLSERLRLGFDFSPRIRMSALSRYSGLFADRGRFDMPANYAVGLALQARPDLLLAMDVKRIAYSGVAAVANPSTNFFQAPLGASNGAGFGWQDVTAVKLGVEWQYDPSWTVRAGYGHASNPVQTRDVTFNILAPGVVQEHYTLGFTRAVDAASSVTVAILHAPERSVSGSSLLNPLFQGAGAPPGAAGAETIRLREDSIGISWTHTL